MANQLVHLLNAWHPRRDELQWVLGVIYKTAGSCYRKAGAMMLFNSMGQQYGLLSGGCLESDIQRHARRVMQHGMTVTLRYDATDEDDLSFQLGIGCGGIVHILLQPVLLNHNYLGLEQIHTALNRREGGYYHQLVANDSTAKAHFVPDSRLSGAQSQDDNAKPRLVHRQEDGESHEWLVTPIRPQSHLLVIGGGLDAQPVINIAAELGWETSLWDLRPANARREHFMAAGEILDCGLEGLASYARTHHVDAVVLITHNVKFDAQALAALQDCPARYMALLGPVSRREKVLRAAKLTEAMLKIPLSGPAGLNIGAELPEGIALSILAECHASLMQSKGMPLGADVAA